MGSRSSGTCRVDKAEEEEEADVEDEDDDEEEHNDEEADDDEEEGEEENTDEEGSDMAVAVAAAVAAAGGGGVAVVVVVATVVVVVVLPTSSQVPPAPPQMPGDLNGESLGCKEQGDADAEDEDDDGNPRKAHEQRPTNRAWYMAANALTTEKHKRLDGWTEASKCVGGLGQAREIRTHIETKVKSTFHPHHLLARSMVCLGLAKRVALGL